MLTQESRSGVYRYRPDYLRIVFKRDPEGNIVRSEEGMRFVAAVERVSGGAVVETMPVNNSSALTEEATTSEPVVEIVLLEA